ncbi:MAG: TraB/GumN family protein, partial [Pseudomonadota bacterium]
TFDAALEKAKATEGPGAPAMWTLSDEDTTVYLFGTVHLLRPDLEWRTDAFNAAVSSADKIVFEVDMKSEAAQSAIMTDFVGRGMFQDGRTLKGVLEDSDEAIISAAFDSVGLPIDAMNTFEPWMASMNLGIMKLVNDGYDPNAGVEMVIEEEAAAAGKSFGYLETISQQADAFDLLPEQDQIAMLYETALLLDESPRMLDLLVSEWAEGDLEGISALVYNPDGGGFTEAAYESVLVKRNEAWVPQIEAMLDEPGIVFIAVGAGHLAGPDSVVTMLRDKGYTIEGP